MRSTATIEPTDRGQEAELLIPEVEHETRRRRRRITLRTLAAVATAAVLAVALVVATGGIGDNTANSRSSNLPSIRGAIPLDLSRGLPASMKAGQLVSCAGLSCVVVGSGTGHSVPVLVARLYQSNRWHWLPSPLGLSSSQLSGLSCSTSSYCVLTGSYFTASPKGLTRGFAEVLDTGHWTFTRLPVPAGSISSSLDAVSCASPSWCVAMGSDRTGSSNRVFATVWDGSEWRLVPMPLPADSWGGGPAQASGVSCVATSWCMAVGSYTARVQVGAANLRGSITKPFAERWSDGRWKLLASPPVVHSAGSDATSIATELRLAGVSCVSRTWCAASGIDDLPASTEPQAAAELAIWSGSSWSTVLGSSWRLLHSGPHSASWKPNPTVGASETGLGTVACSSVLRCVTYVIPNRFFGLQLVTPLALYEHDVRGWFAVKTTGGKDIEQSANDVSCMTNGACVVVGTDMTIGGSSAAAGAFVYGAGTH